MKISFGKIYCCLVLFYGISFCADAQQNKSLELSVPEIANKDHAACVDIHFVQGYSYVAGSGESMHAHIDPGMNCDADSQSTSRRATPSGSTDSGNDLVMKYGISVYPNPTSQNINVLIANLSEGQSALVYLFDVRGKSVLTKSQTKASDSIDLTPLSSGIYQLNVLINNERIGYRILKL